MIQSTEYMIDVSIDDMENSNILTNSEYIQPQESFKQPQSLFMEEPEPSHDYHKEVVQRQFVMTSEIVTNFTKNYESIVYNLKSEQSGQVSEVIRTYSHFEWLQNALSQKHLGFIIPSIPPKTVYAKLNLWQKDTHQIRDERYQGLQLFLEKLMNHPILTYSVELNDFFTLSETDLVAKYFERTPLYNQVGSVVKTAAFKSFDILGSIFTSKKTNDGTNRPQNIKPIQLDQKQEKELRDWRRIIQMQSEQAQEVGENFKNILRLKVEQTNQNTILNSQLFSWFEDTHDSIHASLSKQLNEEMKVYQELLISVGYPLDYLSKDLQNAGKILTDREERLLKLDMVFRKYKEPTTPLAELPQLEKDYEAQSQQLQQMTRNLLEDLPWFQKGINKQQRELLEKHYHKLQQLSIHVFDIWKQADTI